MSVYVDRLRDWGWKYGPSCHMIADSLEELHDFAEKIGLKRIWFQSGKWPHYDLTRKKREEAIEAGAVPLYNRRLFMGMCKDLREVTDG